MDDLTLLVKEQIHKRYKSVRKFADEVGIPMTTIVSALKKGIGGTSYFTVCKICNKLDIRLLNGIYPIVFDGQISEIIDGYGSLDENGRHTLGVVYKMEVERCKNKMSSDEGIDSTLVETAISHTQDVIELQSDIEEVLRKLSEDNVD